MYPKSLKIMLADAYNASMILKWIYTPIMLKIMPAKFTVYLPLPVITHNIKARSKDFPKLLTAFSMTVIYYCHDTKRRGVVQDLLS